MPSGGGSSDGGICSIPMESSAPWTPSMSENSMATMELKTAPRKSMKLGKRKPGDIFAEDMEVAQEQPAAPAVNPLLDAVRVQVTEQVVGNLEMHGGLAGEATCNGSFQVTVDPSKADQVCFKLAPQRQDFKYQVHPSLNKASYAQNMLEVRQGLTAFPIGGCLRWQLKTSDDGFLPVTLSCWPTATEDGTQIVLELELTDQDATLENVCIAFPASDSSRPSVSSASPGEAAHRDGQVVWHIPVFDASEGSGTLEFTANADTATLLPATFEATQSGITRCPMEILECYHQAGKDAISFACEKRVAYNLKIGV